MNYTVHLSAHARSYLRRLPRAQFVRVDVRLRELASDPYGADISKPLHGTIGLRTSRVGSLRILYSIEEEIRVVEVAEVGPRGDIYRG